MSNITATPLSTRSHVMVAELEDDDYGYRYWTEPMLKVQLDLHLNQLKGVGLSDYCCATSCWCIPTE